MKIVGLVPVLSGQILLLKSRNPRLVQRMIPVKGPTGTYQRMAWVLPGDNAEAPKRAQFDLFDQGDAPDLKGKEYKQRKKKESLSEQLHNAEVAEQDRKVTSAFMHDMKAEWKLARDEQKRQKALEDYLKEHPGNKPGDEYKKHLVAYDITRLDDQKVADSVSRSNDPGSVAAFALEYARGLGDAIPEPFIKKMDKMAEKYESKEPIPGIGTIAENLSILGHPVKNLEQFKQGEYPISKDSWEDALKFGDAVERDGKKYMLYVGNEPGEKFWGETRVSDHSKVKLTPYLKGKVKKFLDAVSSNDRSELPAEQVKEIDDALSPKVVEAIAEMILQGKEDKVDRRLDRAAKSVHPFFAFLNKDDFTIQYLISKVLGKAPIEGSLHAIHYKKGEDSVKVLEALKSSARNRFGGKDAGFYTMQYLDSFDRHVDGLIERIKKEVVNKYGIFRTRDKDQEYFNGSPEMKPDVRALFDAYNAKPMKKSVLDDFRIGLSKAFGSR
jgi:hypothetical protein